MAELITKRELMQFLENLRSIAFWAVDTLKGGSVRKHYSDIKFLIENAGSDKASQKHDKYLMDLLHHAVTTTAFYEKHKGFVSLQDFPVIDKNIIRNDLNSFCSKSFKGQKLRKVTTSGSTGTPFSVFHDEIKRNRHTAENIYFSDIIGCILGSRIYYLRVWNIINKKSWFKSWIQNIVMHDASSLSDENLQNLIEQLQTDESTKSILAFASTHEALSRFAAKYPVQPIPVKVKSLITISETLPEGAREVLKKTFGCPVISRYSNIENGFLAQQCLTENQEYHLNLASFHFELLNPDNDKPVKPGELGRVVVTDLFNYGMPIIRYDTGDMAVLSDRSICGAPGPVFKKIEGRRVDFITDTAGNLLSPHVITNTMWKYASVVSQFQFIQNGHKEYLIKINIGDKEFNQTDILVKDLKSYVGSDAIINLEFVNDIPILASGKRKKIVDNYKQK